MHLRGSLFPPELILKNPLPPKCCVNHINAALKWGQRVFVLIYVRYFLARLPEESVFQQTGFTLPEIVNAVQHQLVENPGISLRVLGRAGITAGAERFRCDETVFIIIVADQISNKG